MVELNQQITWVPEHVKHGQFGKWLENARDWSISRNRFWGSPIPVWKSDNPEYPRIDVYGSFEELERDFGVEVDRPAPAVHRPPDPAEPRRPDRATPPCAASRTCSTCGSTRARCRSRRCTTRSRTPSGSSTTSRATSSSSTSARPAAGSTPCTCWRRRCSTGRRSRRASATASCSAPTGRRCRKSLRNYPDVREVFDRDGADAMRWFLMSSPILRGGNLVVTEQGIRDGVRQVLIPLWNTWYFFSLYANAVERRRGLRGEVVDRPPPTRSTATCWPSCGEYVETMQGQLDAYDIAGACESTRSVPRRADQLVHPPLAATGSGTPRAGRTAPWRSAAFDTLYTALEVRHAAWPRRCCPSSPRRSGAASRAAGRCTSPTGRMPPTCRRTTRSSPRWTRRATVCSTASSLRKAEKLRVRLPLPRPHRGHDRRRVAAATFGGDRRRRGQRPDGHRCSTSPRRSEADFGITPAAHRQRPGRRPAAGPRRAARRSRAASPATGRWPTTARSPPAGSPSSRGSTPSRRSSTPSRPGRTRHRDAARRRLRRARHRGHARAGAGGAGPRRRARRAAGPPRRRPRRVSDRITLTVTGGQAVWEATVAHQALIVEETLAAPVRLGSPARGAAPARRRRRDGRRRRAAGAHQGDEALMAGTGKSMPLLTRPSARPRTTSRSSRRMREAEEAILARAPEHDLSRAWTASPP